MKSNLFLLLAALLCAATFAQAQTEKRIALVIGNSAYPLSPLRNPVNDARSMQSALQECGFEVIIAENATRTVIKAKVKEFTDRLATYDVGLFFYAGHGLEVDGINYLVPTDMSKGAQKADIPEECVPSQWVQERMAAAGQYDKTNIVILDACRNNPYRSWGRTIDADAWVMPKQVPTGLITCFAASQGETAADGDGNNGLYTSVLLKHLRTRGVTIEEVFKRVRIELLQRGGQVPIENTKLTKTFYFVPGSGTTPTPTPTPTPIATDSDGDGVPDAGDECPKTYGEKRFSGCPDSDNDGIPNNNDKCPYEAGTPSNNGCPVAAKPTPEPDSDGDGVLDKYDHCPSTYGPESNNGCPKPAPAPSTSAKAFTETVGTAGFGFVKIPAGNFDMGSNTGESDEKPVHNVTLDGFYMGQTEVTQAQWREIMGSNPSYFKDCDNCPVERVSYDDIQTFLAKLNARTRQNYRLPTEAEWEYAARGGQNYTYAGSNNLDEVAWHNGNSGSKTHEVMGKTCNGFGLYDMTGNVWEWCSDWYGAYSSGAQSNPQGASSGSIRVDRGGSWYNDAAYCRTADRYRDAPAYRINVIGFRLCRSL